MSGSGVPTAPKASHASSQALTDRPSWLPARGSRSKPCTAVAAAAAAAQQQQATLAGSSQPGEDRVLSAFDKTPSCIILPTGKEFKLQIRYRNGKHPLLGFDAAGLVTAADAVLGNGQPHPDLLLQTPPEQQQQQQQNQQQQQQQTQQQQGRPWASEWLAATQQQQQQLPPLSKHHIKRLLWQQHQLQLRVQREQQQHLLQQQLATYSQQAAAVAKEDAADAPAATSPTAAAAAGVYAAPQTAEDQQLQQQQQAQQQQLQQQQQQQQEQEHEQQEEQFLAEHSGVNLLPQQAAEPAAAAAAARVLVDAQLAAPWEAGQPATAASPEALAAAAAAAAAELQDPLPYSPLQQQQQQGELLYIQQDLHMQEAATRAAAASAAAAAEGMVLWSFAEQVPQYPHLPAAAEPAAAAAAAAAPAPAAATVPAAAAAANAVDTVWDVDAVDFGAAVNESAAAGAAAALEAPGTGLEVLAPTVHSTEVETPAAMPPAAAAAVHKEAPVSVQAETQAAAPEGHVDAGAEQPSHAREEASLQPAPAAAAAEGSTSPEAAAAAAAAAIAKAAAALSFAAAPSEAAPATPSAAAAEAVAAAKRSAAAAKAVATAKRPAAAAKSAAAAAAAAVMEGQHPAATLTVRPLQLEAVPAHLQAVRQQQQQLAVPLPLPPLQSEQQQQQQQRLRPLSSSSSRTVSAQLVDRLWKCRTCWGVCVLVLGDTRYINSRSSSRGGPVLQVDAEMWTPVAVAAALQRLRILAPHTLVASLFAKQQRRLKHKAAAQAPTPLGAPASKAGPPASDPRHIKTLIRAFLRLIDMAVGQLTEVPSSALVDAAALSSALLGKACPDSDWWSRGQGYCVLGEAAARLREGRLSTESAIQVGYSYSHCGYSPVLLLQELLGQLQAQPRLLQGISLNTLCRLTYCVISERSHVSGLDPGTLTSAVLQALPLQDMVLAGQQQQQQGQQQQQQGQQAPAGVTTDASNGLMPLSLKLLGGRPYDLVMLLRHTCLLNPEPPAGVVPVVELVVRHMSDMTMQELCAVLDVVEQWDLPNKQAIAAAAAAAALAAAGLDPAGTEAAAASGSGPAGNGSSSSSSVAQQQQQQAGTSGPVVRTAMSAVLLLHRLCGAGYRPPEVLVQHLLDFVGPRLHEVTLLQADLLRHVLIHTWSSPASCQQLMQACLQRWLVPQQQQQQQEEEGLLLLQQQQQLSLQELEQQQLAPAHTSPESAGVASAATAAAGAGCTGSVVPQQQYSLNPALYRLPVQQLKALLVAAGRFGVLPVEQQAAAAAGARSAGIRQQRKQQQQQQQQQPHQQQFSTLADLPIHNSSSSSSSGVSPAAVAFITTVVQDLTPAVLSSWRADMVLALLWAAARLGVSSPQQLLAAACGVLVARMRRQIAAREMAHLVWAAAVLKLDDPAFLQGLCRHLAQCANQLSPRSIASAAWALVQLRCPHTFVLSVLSRELLKPEPWMNSKLAFRVKTWHSTPQQQGQQQQQQQQARFLQQLGTEVGLIKSKGSRDVAELDADAWGSWQRPIPRALLQQIRQMGSSSSSSSSGASSRLQVLQRSSLLDPSTPTAAATRRALQRLLPLGSSTNSSSSSSRSGRPSALGPGPGPSLGHASRGFVHGQHVLDLHPRVRQLGAADVAKLVSSCCLAGWAPPQLFAVLAARATVLMPEMDPASLSQVMWAYGTAQCVHKDLLHAAATRAARLATHQAFSSSRQAAVLLRAFRALGLGLMHHVNLLLMQEVDRLRALEGVATATPAAGGAADAAPAAGGAADAALAALAARAAAGVALPAAATGAPAGAAPSGQHHHHHHHHHQQQADLCRPVASR